MFGDFLGIELQNIIDRLTDRWMNRDFHRVLDVKLILLGCVFPITVILLDFLCIPYFLARFFGLLFLPPTSYQAKTLMVRFSFVTYFALRVLYMVWGVLFDQAKKWYNDLRDSRYLIGTELTNRQQQQQQQQRLRQEAEEQAQ